MDDNAFGQLVSEAIDNIPEKYQDKMQSVAIVISDVPTPTQRASIGLRTCDALFGLYEGVPLTMRGGVTLTRPPDVITIFKHPMVNIFSDQDALKKQVFKTLWHEVAHYFGLNHEQIHMASEK